MSNEAYFQCVNLIGRENLRGIALNPREILEVAAKRVWEHVSKAIYIVTDEKFQVAYVGKVDRKSDYGLAQRMTEHAQSAQKNVFRFVYILPLEEHVSTEMVARFEGLIASYLRPFHSSVHPKLPTS